MSYCFVAAKSAGHILPALALAKHIKQKNPHATITFISTNTPLDNKLLHTTPLVNAHAPLPLPNIPYRRPWRLPLFCAQLVYTFCKSLQILRKNKPKRIVATGGLIAVPVCLAGWLLRIPIDLYELNVQPGSAITWLSKLATRIYYCFDKTEELLPVSKRKKTTYPLYAKLDAPAKTYTELGLNPDKKTIFILGGSQGSEWISHTVKTMLGNEHKLATSINIIHQVGIGDHLMKWRSWYAQHDIPAYVFCFEPTCIPYYKAAHLIICRSGAGTLHELAALGKRYITIPLQAGTTNHQIANARAMLKQYPKLVRILQQSKITKNPDLFANEINKILPCLSTVASKA